MAINLQYGPIGTALGLATQAGQGIGRQQSFQDDLAFANYIKSAQEQENQKASNQINQALHGQAIQASYDASQQAAAQHQNEFNQNLALRQQSEANDQRYAQANLANREAGLGIREQQFGLRQNAIAQLDPSLQATVQATGRLPYVQNGPSPDQRDTQALQAEFRRLQASLQTEQKRQASFGYDPKDLLGTRGEQSQTVPGAAKGLEQQYQNSQQSLALIQQRMQELNSALDTRANGIIAGNHGAVNPQVLNQLAQQGGVQAVQQQAPGNGWQPLNAPGSRGVITPDIAAAYLRRVGGPQHMAEAKAAAVADGYIVP